MVTVEDIRGAVIPLAASLTAALDAAVMALADGSHEAAYAALAEIATGTRAALDEHETAVMEGLLDDE